MLIFPDGIDTVPFMRLTEKAVVMPGIVLPTDVPALYEIEYKLLNLFIKRLLDAFEEINVFEAL